ncbi:MAG: hypothetical protein KC416_12280 [Myxococcales bacterium]|nr:hypothetical protein [Myxococcales bacterium]
MIVANVETSFPMTFSRLLGPFFLITWTLLAFGCTDEAKPNSDSGTDGGGLGMDGSTDMDGGAADGDAGDGGDAGSDGGDVLPPRKPTVFLIDDSDAGPQFKAAFEAAGMTVTEAGNYYDWDGVTPALGDHDVAVLLQGKSYSSDIAEAMDDALVAYVEGGGVLIRTEWGLYNARNGADVDIDLMFPVKYDSGYDYVATWNVVETNHPFLAGVTAPFSSDAGYSETVLEADATLIMKSDDNNPLLTTKQFGKGHVVHVNHDMTYTISTVEPQILKIFVNIAHWSTSK